MELLKVPSQQKRMAAAFVLGGIHISPSSKTPNCGYNQKPLKCLWANHLWTQAFVVAWGIVQIQGTEICFILSSLRLEWSSIKLVTTDGEWGAGICQHSPPAPMKTVGETQSSIERAQERAKRSVCKRTFYMFSCDSASLTENSWSVPKRGENERQ